MGNVWLTWAADAARNAVRGTPYQVVEVAGWQSRGHGGFRVVEGIVGHHTATSDRAQGDYPSLRVVRNGRAGLPGPLCNYGLGRSGTIYVVAAGVAWHAGASRYGGFTDLNDEFAGIEAESAGLGGWTDAQRIVYPRLVGAFLSYIRRDASRYCSHRTCAIPAGRKPDPRGIEDAWMIARASEFMRGGGQTISTPSSTSFKEEPVLQNHRVSGSGTLRLIIPTGRASSLVARAWLSAAVDGPAPGRLRWWAQSDSGGIADGQWTINFANGHSQRPWVELPDGTTQINVQYQFEGGGVIALEAAPR